MALCSYVNSQRHYHLYSWHCAHTHNNRHYTCTNGIVFIQPVTLHLFSWHCTHTIRNTALVLVVLYSYSQPETALILMTLNSYSQPENLDLYSWHCNHTHNQIHFTGTHDIVLIQPEPKTTCVLKLVLLQFWCQVKLFKRLLHQCETIYPNLLLKWLEDVKFQ